MKTRKYFIYTLLACSPLIAQAQHSYESDRQYCLSGQSGQALETCLKEMGAAHQEKRARNLGGNGRDYTNNALQRCEHFKGEEEIACQARILNYGTTEGSVKSGGIIREVETVVVPNNDQPFIVQPQTENPVFLVPKQ